MAKNTGRGSVNAAKVRAHRGTWRTGVDIDPNAVARISDMRHYLFFGRATRPMPSCGWGCPCGATEQAERLLKPVERVTRPRLFARIRARLRAHVQAAHEVC